MATAQQVTAETQVTPLQHFRNKREECQYAVDQLREKQAKLITEIDDATSQIRRGIPSSVRLNECAMAKAEVDKALKLAELELSDATTILARQETRVARQAFDSRLADAIAVRHTLLQTLRTASDLFGQLVQAQVELPRLSNAAAGPLGLANPRDAQLLRDLAEPVNVYTGEWMDHREHLVVHISDCPRILPTATLGAKR